MDMQTFVQQAAALYSSRLTIELVGAPGTAKSSAMHAAAAEMSKRLGEPFGLVVEIVSTMTEQDLRGYLLPQKRDDKLVAAYSVPPFFPHTGNTTVYVDGERQPAGTPVPRRGVVVFDELGQADVPLQKACSPWLLDRRLGEHALPAGWVVWAASNRASDRAGVVRRLSILQNRVIQLRWELPLGQYVSYAAKSGHHPLTVSFATAQGPSLFAGEVPAEAGAFCTNRSLSFADRALRAMAKAEGLPAAQLPTHTAAAEVVAGAIGDAAGVKFMAHLKYGAELVPLDTILKDPGAAKVPKDYLQSVQASVLAAAADRKNIDAIMRYLMRKEFSNEAPTAFVFQVKARDPILATTREVGRWIAENPRFESMFMRY
jgi:hypothetical protein